jgi:hypothetical protein
MTRVSICRIPELSSASHHAGTSGSAKLQDKAAQWVASNTGYLEMKHMQNLNLIGLALTMVAFASGCGARVPVGPFPVALYLGEGQIDPAAFPPLPERAGFEGTLENDLCFLPTEDEVREVLAQAGDLNLSSLVEISEMDLKDITLTATSGDFSAITDIVVTYIPKPVGGVPLAGVELGRASSPTGFGSTIVLTPTAPVDLLALIRENDGNPAPGCPKLAIWVAGNTVASKQAIAWQAEANVDVYAFLGWT